MESNTLLTLRIHRNRIPMVLGKGFRVESVPFAVLQNDINTRSKCRGRRGKPLSATTIRKVRVRPRPVRQTTLPHALRDLNFGRIDQISSHVYRREMFRRQIRGTTGIIARAMPVNMPMKWAVFAIGPNTPKTHIPAKNNVYCTWSRPMWTP